MEPVGDALNFSAGRINAGPEKRSSIGRRLAKAGYPLVGEEKPHFQDGGAEEQRSVGGNGAFEALNSIRVAAHRARDTARDNAERSADCRLPAGLAGPRTVETVC